MASVINSVTNLSMKLGNNLNSHKLNAACPYAGGSIYTGKKLRQHTPIKSSNIKANKISIEEDNYSNGSRRQVLRIFGSFALVSVSNKLIDMPAEAFGGEIEMTDVKYTIEACKPGAFVPARGSYVCGEFTATVNNKLKRDVEAGNVFGFITDVNDNSAAAVNADGDNRTVLAPIMDPIPPGKSTVQFSVVLKKDSVDAGPLKTKAFKAVPSSNVIEDRFKPFDECELSPDTCEDY
mmetsp:Transcript_29892/g.41369  ORF Transcript_29892/g.41369 Transcript_29892/m.41369 type:complete len:236 (+) Transcript_29892:124-831(+)|eukprot:CAMPEP_0196580202 /NCGR_PEP_ID=MMETSP1081-20130531/27710_1 /TAXON_ID=36882 /ORGANISM="Pyramimonas amylifera, Strain CCMP720" /LENGTH=235 /DNA_ID=CAMNT_0041900015 /DNA_START=119 /DNA_END=826 /DNA_ORIENTATION=+